MQPKLILMRNVNLHFRFGILLKKSIIYAQFMVEKCCKKEKLRYSAAYPTGAERCRF